MQRAPNIEDLHSAACVAGKDYYIDPTTGYFVFTTLCHQKRGKCCGNSCRHCPYDHVNVKKKTNKLINPNPEKDSFGSTDSTSS
jgi:hypothetical protein